MQLQIIPILNVYLLFGERKSTSTIPRFGYRIVIHSCTCSKYLIRLLQPFVNTVDTNFQIRPKGSEYLLNSILF